MSGLEQKVGSGTPPGETRSKWNPLRYLDNAVTKYLINPIDSAVKSASNAVNNRLYILRNDVTGAKESLTGYNTMLQEKLNAIKTGVDSFIRQEDKAGYLREKLASHYVGLTQSSLGGMLHRLGRNFLSILDPDMGRAYGEWYQAKSPVQPALKPA